MKTQRTKLVTKISKSFILNLLLLVVANNCFSQWKTPEANNIIDDIIISYEVIYDKELSLEDKKSPEYISEITVAFNKNYISERKFGERSKLVNTFSLYNYINLKTYSCLVSETSKKAIENDFKNPDVDVELVETNSPKMFFEFPCEKGLTMINKTPREIYYTKKIGLKFCRQFKVDGFVMQYPGYSKTLGYYTVKAKKIIHDDLPDSFYSLRDYNIQTLEAYQKNLSDSKKKTNEIRMKYIGKKAETFKEISLKNSKIETKKMLGDVIVYNFWFTTCGPCKAEIPKLNQLKEKYKDKNVHFIAVALDPEYTIRPFLKTTPLDYDIIAEGKWIAEMFGVTSYPTNIITDKKGIIQFYEIGYKSDIIERMSSTLDENLVE